MVLGLAPLSPTIAIFSHRFPIKLSSEYPASGHVSVLRTWSAIPGLFL